MHAVANCVRILSQEPEAEPKVYSYQIVNEYPHDPDAFSQVAKPKLGETFQPARTVY